MLAVHLKVIGNHYAASVFSFLDLDMNVLGCFPDVVRINSATTIPGFPSINGSKKPVSLSVYFAELVGKQLQVSVVILNGDLRNFSCWKLILCGSQL